MWNPANNAHTEFTKSWDPALETMPGAADLSPKAEDVSIQPGLPGPQGHGLLESAGEDHSMNSVRNDHSARRLAGDSVSRPVGHLTQRLPGALPETQFLGFLKRTSAPTFGRAMLRAKTHETTVMSGPSRAMLMRRMSVFIISRISNDPGFPGHGYSPPRGIKISDPGRWEGR